MNFINDEIDQAMLERVNPVFNTAKMTLYQLFSGGDEDAGAIAKALGLTLEQTQNSSTTTALPEQLVANAITMDVRFNTMGKLAEEAGCAAVIDLPCGYTPRAIRFSRKGLHFIGLDLPAAIAEAEPAILSLIEPERRSLVRFAGVDATNYESLEAALSGETGNVCITTEGLMMYFTESEVGVFCDNIRRILEKRGGMWFTADPEITLLYVLILKAVSGDRFAQIIGKSAQVARDKSDVALGKNPLIVRPQDAESGIRNAMAFLARHGLKAERMVLSDHVPVLDSLAQMTPQQADEVRAALKQCAFWKITLADASRKLDATEAGTVAFNVSAELSGGTLQMALTGRLDTMTAPNLLAFYEKHRDEVQAVRVDCGKLDYVSSAGLRVLLIMQKGCEGGVTLYGINDTVKEILEQTGFNSIFSVC